MPPVTSDAGNYATLEDFEGLLGQDFLRAFLGGQETEESAPALRRLLSSASAQINSALQRGGYTVPVQAADIDAALREQTVQLLATHCCVLAGLLLAAGASDLPAGIKLLIEQTKAWIASIETRRMDLLGVSRPAAAAAIEGEGAVLFISTGESPFPTGYHDRARWVG